MRSPEEEEGGDDSPLAAAFKAKRRDLKPTEVSSGPSIHSNLLRYTSNLLTKFTEQFTN